jgi:hypothetical protein
MKFLIDRKNFPKYQRIVEQFSKKEIPDEIIYICDKIKDDISINGNNSFKKDYIFGSYKFSIIIDYYKNNKNKYSSEIDMIDILNNVFQNEEYLIKIPIEINSEKIDYNRTLSIIAHEIRHVYDILNTSELEIKDFAKKRNLNGFKNTIIYKFIFQIYVTLEHELIARNNMIYPSFRWSGEKQKNYIIKKYKETYTYTSLIDLKNFDHLKFINNKDEKELLLITNEFIKQFSNGDFCNTKKDLINYYKEWEIFFKNKSDEYLKYAQYEIDRVFNDISTNKIYENNKLFNHDDLNFNLEKIFDKLIKS